jgi:hypothetical protein
MVLGPLDVAPQDSDYLASLTALESEIDVALQAHNWDNSVSMEWYPVTPIQVRAFIDLESRYRVAGWKVAFTGAETETPFLKFVL